MLGVRVKAGMRGFFLLLFLLPLGLTVCADTASVIYRSGRFIVHTEVLIALSPARVRHILGDYRNLPKVNSGITAVILLQQRARATRMRVFAHACVWFYCRGYSWLQTAKQLPSGDIVTVIDPQPHEQSDFESGTLRYRFIAEGERTRLLFDAELTPAFWLPPMIGPWVMKRKLLREAEETARGVVRIAAQAR